MEKVNEKKGPRGYRFLVMSLNVVFALLVYWLLGFVMDDIANRPGPVLQVIQKKYQDPILVKEKKAINEQIKKRLNTINEQQQQQKILETSIHSYSDTMNQLLDLQKASIQKGITFSSESQKNLQNVTAFYLDYQKQFQDLNHFITKDNIEVQRLQNRVQEIDTMLGTQNVQAEKEYNSLWISHNWAIAGLQLLALVPLLLITAYLYRKYRKGPYNVMIIAVGVAVFLKISMVMHDYFPSYIFKYALILALIYMTARALVSKLRMIESPNHPWLMKQYSEAYQKNTCPMCQFVFKPGISKFFSMENKKTISTPDYQYLNTIDAYTCPCCGQMLFEKCSSCSHLRYSLLSYCDTCGTQKIEENRGL